MLSHDTIIRAENLSKSYRIWSSPLARLRGPLCHRAAELPLLPRKMRARLRHQAESASREFFALHDVSFEIARGESVGIIGRNGAGKSTLLQILTGTLTPTSGCAEVRGRVAALLELGSGFNSDFTGRENVRLNAGLLGLLPHEIDERMESMLAFADIGEFVDQPVKTYSSGMKLRLAFAVIAHIDADVLIIDEALAVGDVFFMQKCMRFLRSFQENGVLLLVTHDPTTITSLCQKALWLDHGVLRAAGPPKEVTEAYLNAYFHADAEAKSELAALNAEPVADARSGSEPAPLAEERRQPVRDQRLHFLNQTNLRNDMQVFAFDPAASAAGAGGARIMDVTLEDQEGHPLAWIVGGEVVTLRVRFEAVRTLRHPIVGFYLKNHLGQWLFGDNTFLTTQGQDLASGPHSRFEARFVFQMPILPAGDYSILLGLADGEPTDHVMHQWIHDALTFKSVTSSLRAGGLIGLPMLSVTTEKLPSASPAPLSSAA